MKNIAIFGASGAIGSALVLEATKHSNVYAFSRNPVKHTDRGFTSLPIDITNEPSIFEASSTLDSTIEFDQIIVATGILHDKNLLPEKSLRDLSLQKFEALFKINTIAPALLMKYFIPKLKKNTRTTFACLSARVGSISDNKLGGWYSYRASKSALNMIIMNAAIETARNRPLSIIVGLHPGTVDSSLSKPFQQNIPKESLFSKTKAAKNLLKTLESLESSDSGKCFDYKGIEISP